MYTKRCLIMVAMVGMAASSAWAKVVPIDRVDAGDPNVRPYLVKSITVGGVETLARNLWTGTTHWITTVPNDPNKTPLLIADPNMDDWDINTMIRWSGRSGPFQVMFETLWSNTNGDANDFIMFEVGGESGDKPQFAAIFPDGSTGATLTITPGTNLLPGWGPTGYIRNPADANDGVSTGAQQIHGLAFAITDLMDANSVKLTNDAVIKGIKLVNRGGADPSGFFAVAPPAYLVGLSDVNVVSDAIVSLRYKGTQYVVANGDLTLGATTRWYVDANGVETLWVDGTPAPAATVSGTSNPKTGDIGPKADNFLFVVGGAADISSIDGINFQQTFFGQPSKTFFIFERGGNDAGTMQATFADGSLGPAVAFTTAAKGGPYANTGYGAAGQNAYGVVFRSAVPAVGVRITASGHDTLSISIPTVDTLH